MPADNEQPCGDGGASRTVGRRRRRFSAALATVLLAGCAKREEPEPRRVDDAATGIVWIQANGSTLMFAETEVTVAQYSRCVAAGGCGVEKLGGIEWKESPWAPSPRCNWARPGYDNHPLNCIDWIQADAFCRWAGGRLLSKAEWHDLATARGTRLYPWGDAQPTCDLAIHNDWEQHGGLGDRKGCGRGESAPTCSAPAGRSKEGLCDLVGNLWEWTDTKEFDGPETEPRYNLGGSWAASSPHLDTDYTLVNPVRFRIDTLGLRCARPADAQGTSATLPASSQTGSGLGSPSAQAE